MNANTLPPEVMAMIDRLSQINATLQEHAKRFCGTQFTFADECKLYEVLTARQAVLEFLADRGYMLECGPNTWPSSELGALERR